MDHLEFCTLGGFFSPVSLWASFERGCSEVATQWGCNEVVAIQWGCSEVAAQWGCSEVAVHILLVPMYHADPCVNQVYAS